MKAVSQTIKSVKGSGLVRFWVAASLLASPLLAGCITRDVASPAKKDASFSASANLAPFVIRRIPLLNNPMDVRNDYVYPNYYTRQRLSWTETENIWHMTFPSRRYAYAGVELRHKVDVANRRELTRLSFRMRPARLAPFLSIALVDQPTNQTARAMTDYWLQDAGVFEGAGWVNIEIALTSFPEEALPVVDVNDATSLLISSPRRPFDWASVSEVRFVSGGGRIPNQEIIVKNLCFRR